MKKPYSKYMDDRIVKILERGIKSGEVQETIAMFDALLLHYSDNGLDTTEDDDIPIGNGVSAESLKRKEPINIPQSEYDVEMDDLTELIKHASDKNYKCFVNLLDQIINRQREQEADYLYEEYGPWD